MSVINQVLNQLEQRGAHTAPAQTMVRPVPPTRRSLVKLLLLALVLTAGGAASWLQLREPAVEVPRVTQPVIHVAAPDEEPVQEILPPASRLSFELSSVPLPSSLREAKDSAAPKLPAVVRPSGKSGKSPTSPSAIPKAAVAQTTANALPMKQISTAQRADAEFRRAAGLMQLGRIADAMAGYEAALRLDAGHDAARQALVALLMESKRNADAEKVLLEGLNGKPENTGLTMLLARLQVERGALEQATTTLEKSLSFADTQADYQAFFAALLQRQNLHKEAINHYQIVLQLVPDNGVWLMGYGISLQAVQRDAEAREAFQRALNTQTLSPELQAFVQQKLKGL